jgi:hypothetical protein
MEIFRGPDSFVRMIAWVTCSAKIRSPTNPLFGPKAGEPGPFQDRVQKLEGRTEGMLGGRLAQRHAALREVMAAGSRRLPVLAILFLSIPRATEK